MFYIITLNIPPNPGGDGQPARQATMATPKALALDEEKMVVVMLVDRWSWWVVSKDGAG